MKRGKQEILRDGKLAIVCHRFVYGYLEKSTKKWSKDESRRPENALRENGQKQRRYVNKTTTGGKNTNNGITE